LPGHLKRERIVHDLEEAENHCALCAQDLWTCPLLSVMPGSVAAKLPERA